MNRLKIDDSTKPPSANPKNYCRFCFSQFQIEPLFPITGNGSGQTVSRIASLIQIELDPRRDAASAICHKCLQQLKEFEDFRNRCQWMDEIVRECRPFPSEELQLAEIQKDARVVIEPLKQDDEMFEAGLQNTSFCLAPNDSMLSNGTSIGPSELSVVLENSEAKKNINFWRVVQRDVGSIPKHVRHALEVAGMCRNLSLGLISPSSISRIEEIMRASVELLISQEEVRGTDSKHTLVRYYGKQHRQNPEQFAFSAEERNIILMIAAAIQEKGIHRYLKAAKLECPGERKMVQNGDKLGQQLVNRIHEYYSARDSGTDEYKNFLDLLYTMKSCEVYRKTNKRIHAVVRCPLCDKKIRTNLSKNNRWQFWSFVRHCKNQHYQMVVSRERSPTRSAQKRTRSRSRGLSILGEETDED